ncbi:hypothetical protein T190_23465 [Sinorhizobium meliloti CCBAU 01290]|nr:hypothetical protein T190_23465 [Sinorhizobium meliloti CCBAU 01290]
MVGSNHSSFAPQYPDIYADLFGLIPSEEVAKFVPAVIDASTLDGKLVMLPRAQFDVSALYFQKSLYQDEAKKTEFKAKYGYDLAPPDTWAQVSDQAEFFAAPPNFYGTQFAGKEEAINGRFYEMLVAEVVNISTRTAARPSIRTRACAPSNGSSSSTRTRRYRRAPPTISGTISDRASPRARSRSISTGLAGHPSSTIRNRRRSPAMSA